MKEKLEEIKTKGLEKIKNVKTIAELEEVRKELTGKKSGLSEVLKSMKDLPVEEKKTIGIMATEIKNTFLSNLQQKDEEIIASMSVLDEPIDLTIPGKKVSGGALHPITQMKHDLNDAFLSLGFEVFNEDDISSEKYAFDNLNFAKNHPARQSMDTYWLEGTEDKEGAERLCLRPHLTGGSVRYLLKHGAPARLYIQEKYIEMKQQMQDMKEHSSNMKH